MYAHPFADHVTIPDRDIAGARLERQILRIASDDRVLVNAITPAETRISFNDRMGVDPALGPDADITFYHRERPDRDAFRELRAGINERRWMDPRHGSGGFRGAGACVWPQQSVLDGAGDRERDSERASPVFSRDDRGRLIDHGLHEGL